MSRLTRLLKSRVARNGAWLFLLQIVNTVLPLVTMPYVTRVLGAESYGVFSLALNWITYFQVIVDYGFVLNGARKVAIIGRANHEELQALYSRIIWARVVLLGISFAAMNIVYLTSGMPVIHYYSMLVLFLMVVGYAFQQTWLFQGMEDMRYITLANAAARLMSVLLIFACITSKDQVLLYCFLYSMTFIGSSAIGLVLARRKYGLRLTRAPLSDVKAELADGWYLFTSSAMTKVFSGIGVTILGFFAPTAVVGAYSAVYKIPFAMTLVFTPVGQAIFPQVSKLFAESDKRAVTFVKKVGIPVVGCFALMALTISVFRYPLVSLLFGDEYVAYSNLCIPLALWTVFGVLNNFLGVQMLVGSGHQKEYSKAFAVGIAAIVLLNVLLGPSLGATGVALAAMLSEMISTFALLFALRAIGLIGAASWRR